MLKDIPIYFWQKQQWNRLLYAYRNNQLHHACLLQGVSGLGLSQFAEQWGKFLLCENRNLEKEYACNQCHSCHWFDEGIHPDWQIIKPEEEDGFIKIDQIRELEEGIAETSARGGARIIYITPADKLNMNAGNALLKILEEPPAQKTYFILFTENSQSLLPTIQSRTFLLPFYNKSVKEYEEFFQQQIPSRIKVAQALLPFYDNAPLTILEILKNDEWYKVNQLFFDWLIENSSTNSFEEVFGKDLKKFLTYLYRWLYLLLRYQSSTLNQIQQQQALGLEGKLEKISKIVNCTQIFNLVEQILNWLTSLHKGIRLNHRLIYDAVFYQWKT